MAPPQWHAGRSRSGGSRGAANPPHTDKAALFPRAPVLMEAPETLALKIFFLMLKHWKTLFSPTAWLLSCLVQQREKELAECSLTANEGENVLWPVSPAQDPLSIDGLSPFHVLH